MRVLYDAGLAVGVRSQRQHMMGSDKIQRFHLDDR